MLWSDQRFYVPIITIVVLNILCHILHYHLYHHIDKLVTLDAPSQTHNHRKLRKNHSHLTQRVPHRAARHTKTRGLEIDRERKYSFVSFQLMHIGFHSPLSRAFSGASVCYGRTDVFTVQYKLLLYSIYDCTTTYTTIPTK
jgi:hypothetical protein